MKKRIDDLLAESLRKFKMDEFKQIHGREPNSTAEWTAFENKIDKEKPITPAEIEYYTIKENLDKMLRPFCIHSVVMSLSAFLFPLKEYPILYIPLGVMFVIHNSVFFYALRSFFKMSKLDTFIRLSQ